MPNNTTSSKGPEERCSDSGNRFAQVLENRDRIYRYITTMLPARHDAEDVFQQTCLVLWEKSEQFDACRQFLPWAFGVARNEVRRFIRENSKERLFFSEELMETIATAAAERADAELADELNRSTILNQCLDKLSERQQAVLRESYCSSRPIKVVAVEFGFTPQALYMRLSRLRQLLLDCMLRSLAVEPRSR